MKTTLEHLINETVSAREAVEKAIADRDEAEYRLNALVRKAAGTRGEINVRYWSRKESKFVVVNIQHLGNGDAILRPVPELEIINADEIEETLPEAAIKPPTALDAGDPLPHGRDDATGEPSHPDREQVGPT